MNDNDYVIWCKSASDYADKSITNWLGNDDYWTEDLERAQAFTTRKDALNRAADLGLAERYVLGVVRFGEVPEVQKYVRPDKNTTTDLYTAEQLAEARRVAREQAFEERDQFYVTEVMAWYGGCYEGKREFLAHIGIDKWLERTYTVTVTVEAQIQGADGDIDEACREIDRAITNHTDYYVSDYDYHEQ